MDTATVNTPKAELSFKPEDLQADLAKIAAETGMTYNKPEVKTEEVAPPTVTPTTPVQPTQATVTSEATKTEIPEKFKTDDGSLDTEKLNKSMVNVDEALATYLAKEKELKRKINEVKAQENAYLKPTAPIVHTPAPSQINPDFSAQLEADLQKEGFGKVASKLFTAAQEAAVEQVRKEIETLRNVQAETTTRTQIEAIGKNDPWVYSPEGINTLNKVLEDQPYLLQAPDPYKAAYLQYKGMSNVVSRSNPQVLTTTPMARTSAPVPTVQAASQTHTSPEDMFDKLTPNQKAEFIKKVPVAEQEKWFIRAGFPSFNAR